MKRLTGLGLIIAALCIIWVVLGFHFFIGVLVLLAGFGVFSMIIFGIAMILGE